MDLNRQKVIIFVTLTIAIIGIFITSYSQLKKDVVVTLKGETKKVSTFKSNVEELLKEQNIKYDSNDKINIALDKKLEDGTEVEVIDVKSKTVKKYKEVPFEVEILEDKDLLKGESEVIQEGKSGKNELIYNLTYHDNKQVDEKFVKEVVSKDPVNKIIRKGVKEEVLVATSRGSRRNAESPRGNNMRVEATAYTGHGITSTGTTPRWGTIAVDPRIIPYGSKVYIPQFDKVFIAEDCGGAIKGNKIDIFMHDSTSVYNWGRRSIDIQIIG
ncbi:G5 domain-containing protein [Paraclostridium bifermentans]|uniref:G5 domain-containing protein n=1 Tax=Paraclostridium bifermentans TaxID=1490 RepID=UPI00359C9E42